MVSNLKILTLRLKIDPARWRTLIYYCRIRRYNKCSVEDYLPRDSPAEPYIHQNKNTQTIFAKESPHLTKQGELALVIFWAGSEVLS